MTNNMYLKIESILIQYTCAKITAKTAKKAIFKLGYKIDLRKWIYDMIDIECIETGELTEIRV